MLKRYCQSTIVRAACAELCHSDRNLRTAWFEKGDRDLKKKHWVDFYVHTLPTHIYVQTTCKVNFAPDEKIFVSSTILRENSFKETCWWILMSEDNRMDCFTRGNIFMDYRLIFWPETSVKCLKCKHLDDGFVSYKYAAGDFIRY